MNSVSQPALSESEYIYDERRGVVVNARDLNSYQFNIYKRSMYKTLRPDLTNHDFLIWKEKWRVGETYLSVMRYTLNKEMQRSWLQGHPARSKDTIRYFEKELYQTSQPFIRGPRYHIERTWEEASKVVAFVDRIAGRINKYFLHYPLGYENLSKKSLSQIEDELTAKFVRELRKAPYVQAE